MEVVDVDTFLNKSLFYHILTNNLGWPWVETHFILRTYCINCKTNAVYFHDRPWHIVADMNEPEHLIHFLKNPEFWCFKGEYLMYDHYPLDECDFCT
ncbi:unnamed protein product [Diatraea saccharalis]|uniref:Uncharacterized protein n=1 Tax=Diatraea saccharalis TaxID=40085 RepID=A0A9N9R679_9NEOP|nr:unnamed protein product [Diatraea saccharalis]